MKNIIGSDLGISNKLLWRSFLRRKGFWVSLIVLPMIFGAITTGIINGIVFVGKTPDVNPAIFLASAKGAIMIQYAVYISILPIIVGVFLASYKQTTFYKRMMVSKMNKSSVITSFFLFIVAVTLSGFALFSLINIQSLIILSNYSNPYIDLTNTMNGLTLPDGSTINITGDLKNVILEEVNGRVMFVGFNNFNIYSYLTSGILYSLLLSAAVLFIVGFTRSQSYYTFAALTIILIGPRLYALIGFGMFYNHGGTPEWFSALYPVNPSSIGRWMVSDLFRYTVDTFTFVDGTTGETMLMTSQNKDAYIALVIPAIITLGLTGASYKVWKWKEL